MSKVGRPRSKRTITVTSKRLDGDRPIYLDPRSLLAVACRVAANATDRDDLRPLYHQLAQEVEDRDE